MSGRKREHAIRIGARRGAALGGNYGDRPELAFRLEGDRGAMTLDRARRLVTTLAVILFLPGGASSALADDDTDAPTERATPAQNISRSPAGRSHRLIEDAWLAEQRHAARRR